MKNTAKRDQYITREGILKLLSDDEIARVSTTEAGPPLAKGDEYVDLQHLYLGVRRMEANIQIKMGEVLPRRAVRDSTWSQICARIASPQAASR